MPDLTTIILVTLIVVLLTVFILGRVVISKENQKVEELYDEYLHGGYEKILAEVKGRSDRGYLLRGLALMQLDRIEDYVNNLSKVGFKEMNMEPLFFEAIILAHHKKQEEIYKFLLGEYRRYPKLNKTSVLIFTAMDAYDKEDFEKVKTVVEQISIINEMYPAQRDYVEKHYKS
ncbi:hypothetical protein AZF37_05890 [endosymbiont 'TC1' of Trimyema compressum]|uniref:hypothetical protein n=1 Tax=endosymbiont 'TC1' of Trimyema compressum TaxID=243899 RepID=UPI0007F0DB26|nr:hypothetical protein [endosymbiont 'TC1' of Trimyema compressum]AMP20770.1 hypothetical protein AZF37_05890 [endosymbiont 'TC1' of Trimyema compressum]